MAVTKVFVAVTEVFAAVTEIHKNPFCFARLGLLYFAEKKCDIVVLETGMGGRDDATNAIAEVMMEIFASISLDHLGVLGNDLTEIAECDRIEKDCKGAEHRAVFESK